MLIEQPRVRYHAKRIQFEFNRQTDRIDPIVVESIQYVAAHVYGLRDSDDVPMAMAVKLSHAARMPRTHEFPSYRLCYEAARRMLEEFMIEVIPPLTTPNPAPDDFERFKELVATYVRLYDEARMVEMMAMNEAVS
jgi:hypothetical protein